MTPAPEWMVEFKRCEPWIREALQSGGNTHGIEDVLAMVASGECQLWPAPRGAIVTTVLRHPLKTELFMWLAGGEMDQLRAMYRDIEAWGREQGCTVATLAGRRGWARDSFLRDQGYSLQWVAVSKELSA